MTKSKLLKEAIADAKAVRETAIANAKIALEEAFTPRLQSILSRKLQAEMEEEDFDDDAVELEEEYGAEDAPTSDSTGIGAGKGSTDSGTSGKQPTGISTNPHTKLDPETDSQSASVGHEDDEMPLAENDEFDFDSTEDDEEEFEIEEGDEFDFDSTEDDEEEFEIEEGDEFDFDSTEEEDEDELDLEEIIRELEAGSEEEVSFEESEDEDGDGVIDDPTGASFEESEDEEFGGEDDEFSDEIDLDEILREMGYGDDEEEVSFEESEDEIEVPVDDTEELEAELEEAYSTIKSLKRTINEVNLLNAKLLYTNKLFRSYNLTNEQKVKVVENLDRTSSVREVKLVYATLAESMKFTGTERKMAAKKNITEGLASKPSASTAPKKEIITESGNTMADRFKKLAGIIE